METDSNILYKEALVFTAMSDGEAATRRGLPVMPRGSCKWLSLCIMQLVIFLLGNLISEICICLNQALYIKAIRTSKPIAPPQLSCKKQVTYIELQSCCVLSAPLLVAEGRKAEDEDQGWDPAAERRAGASGWRVQQIPQGAEVPGVHRHAMRRDASQVA